MNYKAYKIDFNGKILIWSSTTKSKARYAFYKTTLSRLHRDLPFSYAIKLKIIRSPEFDKLANRSDKHDKLMGFRGSQITAGCLTNYKTHVDVITNC